MNIDRLLDTLSEILSRQYDAEVILRAIKKEEL